MIFTHSIRFELAKFLLLVAGDAKFSTGIEPTGRWGMDGPSLAGDVLDNIKLIFDGAAADRMMLDDFEIAE